MINLKRKAVNEQFAHASNDSIYETTGAKIAGGVALATASVGAHAEIVTTGIVTAVGDAATAVGVIGAAVVLVVLAVKTYKWLARSL